MPGLFGDHQAIPTHFLAVECRCAAGLDSHGPCGTCPQSLAHNPSNPFLCLCSVWLWSTLTPKSQSWRTTLSFQNHFFLYTWRVWSAWKFIFLPPQDWGGGDVDRDSSAEWVLHCPQCSPVGLSLSNCGENLMETLSLLEPPSLFHPTSLYYFLLGVCLINPFHTNPSLGLHLRN